MKLDKIVIASNNKGKISEFKRLLQGCIDIVLCPFDLGIDSNPEETGTTFSENALIKARALSRLTDLPVLADDSGLTAAALNGEPGIYSSRYAGINATDKDNRNKLIRNLRDCADRSAFFTAVLALIIDGAEYLFEGRSEGVIIENERGDNGFGYDPIFFSKDLNKTFAQASDEEKNSCSHRARAVHSMLSRLSVID